MGQVKYMVCSKSGREINVGDEVAVFLPYWFTKKNKIEPLLWGHIFEGKVKVITDAAFLVNAQWIPISVMDEIRLKGEVREQREKPNRNAAILNQEAKTVDAEELPPVPITKFQPWEHQKRAYHFAYDKRGAMLAMGMGTGKSKVVVDLIQNRGHKKVLIVCPKPVVATWTDEPKKHASNDFKFIASGLNKGSVAKKLEKAKECLELAGGYSTAIIAINYDSVWREPFGSWALNAGFDLIVADESHKIKSPQGKASKWFDKAGKIAPYRLCLTGTPMPHNPTDIFGQYRFLDNKLFGSSHWSFKNKYANCDRMFPSKILGLKPEKEPEFNKKFYSLAFRVSEDVLDLPEVTHERILFDLEGKTKKHYAAISKDFFTEIQEKEISAANAAVKLMRLQQLTGGFLKTDEGDIVEVGTEKKEVFADKLDGLAQREPVVVFARFQKDLDTIQAVAESQGRRYAELSGRKNHLQEWKDGEFDVIGVQIQAGGAGVDLTRACYCFYYSVGHSLGDYEQSLRRSHRPGQERPVFFYHLIARSSVDVDVYNALSKKQNVVQTFLSVDRSIT